MLLSFLFIGAGFTSCSNEEIDSIIENNQNNSVKTCSMNFNGSIVPFDVNIGTTRSSTRAGGDEWSDGSVIYLKFATSSSTVAGTATYSSSKGWSISYSGTLPSNVAGKVTVCYIENPASVGAASVTLNGQSIVYVDKEGIYEYNSSSNTCTVSANLSPYTSRIRFKGSVGTSIMIDGISTYSSYDFSKFELTISNSSIKLTVDNTGYTPYIYGYLADSNNRKLSVTNGDYIFSTLCKSEVLAIGQTGFMNIPTYASHSGWEVANALVTSGAVDLGLSVKWAACNVGASSPEEYGGYYAWGELETKSEYSSSNYKYAKTNYSYNDIGTNIAKTEYDVAYKTLGDGWQMPNSQQAQELIDNCTWEKATYNNVAGCKVTGPNGNAIFIPKSGYYNGLSNNYKGDYIDIWLSNVYSDSNTFAYYLDCYSKDPSISRNNRAYGMAIRPIYTK